MPLPKGHHGHAGLFRRSWLNKEKESLPDVVRSNDFRLKRGFRKSGLSREPWLQGCCVLKPWRVAWDISVVSKHTLRKPAGLTTKLFLCSFLKPTFYTWLCKSSFLCVWNQKNTGPVLNQPLSTREGSGKQSSLPLLFHIRGKCISGVGTARVNTWLGWRPDLWTTHKSSETILSCW